MGRSYETAGGTRLTDGNEALRDRVRSAISSQKQPTVTVLSTLHAAHDELGYLPDEAIEEVAAYTEATINDVWGVASFYTNFRFTPPAEHALEVCWGPTCHILGAARIKKHCLEALDLTDEGNTTDGRLSLKYNTCLGACSQAPVISVDHRLHGRVTPEDMQRHIERLLDGVPAS